MSLSPAEVERYKRQMLIAGWNAAGQEKLRAATVFIAGAGGLGSPVCIYLAAAGVGTLRICDCGAPEMSNLNRQILHTEQDFHVNKAISAQDTLKSINPHVAVTALPKAITDQSAAELVGDSSIIVDCLDNFEARHALNRYAAGHGTPFVHGGIYGLNGQMTVLHPPQTPCLACIFPPSVPKEVFPVAGVTPGVIGLLQATETIKLLLGIGTPLTGKLLMWDGEMMDFQKIDIRRAPDCPVCGSLL